MRSRPYALVDRFRPMQPLFDLVTVVAIAATQDYSQSQQGQSHTGQAEYGQEQESADYSYTDKQAD
ncbi:MAG: hypothetical protein ACR2FS_06450 [Phormidesmis sp.]